MTTSKKNKGIENLIPFTERSEEEVRELNKKGGIKSGEVRREKRALKEELQILMGLMTSEGITNQERLCLALLGKAQSGDVQAFNAIRDTMGEKPVDKVESENINTEKIQIEIVE